MNSSAKPLIVGAGPVGLGAALFLKRAGIATRIIDKAPEPSRYSKALAVNPRTLEILEPLGITEKMLALGLPIRGAHFWQHGEVIGEMSLARLEHKYPFMLALSQATTERLLKETLEAEGGKVERGTELVTCANGTDGVKAELKHEPESPAETVECPWLLAADGAHSTAREAVKVSFEGSSFPNPWHLMDVPLKTSIESNRAHVFLQDNGFLFLLRVIDDASSHSAEPAVWRVISSRPELLEEIPKAEICGSPLWKSDFHVAHRINAQLSVGNVYFAGDAAHVHSPMGARGMNLGLEDAWTLGQLVKLGEMQRYGPLRHRVDQQVVKRVEQLSRVVSAESATARLVRPMVIRWLTKVPPIYHRFVAALTGLDHGLEPQLRTSELHRMTTPEVDREVARRERGQARSA